eukprot:CCRYP_018611-RA/>CCRYP_018611-RA protein AED:0.41 eAED:1.00 QI:0/-1/0/1/-1/0/1/0/24
MQTCVRSMLGASPSCQTTCNLHFE